MNNNGIDAQSLTIRLNGHWHGAYGTAPCPICQSEGRKTQDALTIGIGNGGKLLLDCKKTGCGFREIVEAVGFSDFKFAAPDLKTQREAEAKQAAYSAKKMKRARAIWDHAGPIQNTHAEAYLRARGITADMPKSLRFAPDIYHAPSGRWCCAMVADVSTGGVHRTYFTKKGERLSKNAKMMIGSCSGGHVTLSEGAGRLIVCEGIETGLALASGLLKGNRTIWAALSTSGMKSLDLPPDCSRLTIATDGDDAGRSAGNVLAERAVALGWDVRLLPAPEGRDWADIRREVEA